MKSSNIQQDSFAQESMYDQHALHARLAHFNSGRVRPGTGADDWQSDIEKESQMRIIENAFLEEERRRIQPLLGEVPDEPDAFVAWFENLRQCGPGQGDALFPWLANEASLEEMKWFLTQEAAGEAGFEDLVALTQIKMPARAKLEMARNYWDEMGRGNLRGMHGRLLEESVTGLDLRPRIAHTVWESLALGNLMLGLAMNRRFAYHSVGALGAIEMTAPGRVSLVNEGLLRLGVPTPTRLYFQLHAGLDIEHSRAWNSEVLYSLVESDPGVAIAIAEGALMRMASGARCYARYRSHFGAGRFESGSPEIAAREVQAATGRRSAGSLARRPSREYASAST